MSKETQGSIKKARNLAKELYNDKRYGHYTYFYHLQATEQVLVRFGADPQDSHVTPLLMAAWLHDSIEDGFLSVADILTKFNRVTACLVDAITDGEGKDREERQQASFKKIQEYPDAVMLKLADRIANVEASCSTGVRRYFDMYKAEHGYFKKALFGLHIQSASVTHMWKYLDHLLTF